MEHVVLISHWAPHEPTGAAARVDGIETGLRDMGLAVSRVVVEAGPGRWRRRPRQWWYFRDSADLRESICEAVSPETTLAIASYLPIAALALPIFRDVAPRAFRVYDAHNDELVLARRGGNWNLHYVRRLERQAISAADAVTVAGLSDLSALRERYPNVSMANIPQAADKAQMFRPSMPRARTLFAYGNWNWPPNQEGLLRLAPIHHVDGELRIYGRVEDRLRTEIERRAAGGSLRWKFRGFADTLDSMLEDAQCPLIMPVWAGAGSKTRTAQMAGRAVPIYGPYESVRGLPDWLAEHISVVEDPAALLSVGFDCTTSEWRAAAELRLRVQKEYNWSHLVAAAICKLRG